MRLAGNGLEALAQVAKQQPDLVPMDMRMPQMDGLEATRRWWDMGCEVPIVALTANAMMEDRPAVCPGHERFSGQTHQSCQAAKLPAPPLQVMSADFGKNGQPGS